MSRGITRGTLRISLTAVLDIVSFPVDLQLQSLSLKTHFLNMSTDRVVLPRVDVAVHVEHRSDVEVHVSHHRFHFVVCFVCLQDLISKEKGQTCRI